MMVKDTDEIDEYLVNDRLSNEEITDEIDDDTYEDEWRSKKQSNWRRKVMVEKIKNG